MRVTLIHNPYAGDDEQPAGDRLVRLIRSKGHDVIYRSSKDNDWDNALKESSDIVAAAGGDGLVGKVAKHLVGGRTPIALLPMGTANNVARTLGLADKPLEELVAGWTSARRKTFDVGVASGPWGSKCMIEGLGLDYSQRRWTVSLRQTRLILHTQTMPMRRLLPFWNS